MVDKEYNLRAGVYKVQTFGTTHHLLSIEKWFSNAKSIAILYLFRGFCSPSSPARAWEWKDGPTVVERPSGLAR